jgi:hypothetical protein
MRVFFFITLLFVSSFSFAQTSFLKDAVAKLDKALVEKDTVTLKQLLHKDATYGHSNGWVETKDDVIKDLATGKLAYKKITSKDVKWEANKDWATMRSTTKLKYVMNGSEVDLKLHVLQVWLKTNKGWQLIARQSTKIN